MLTSFLGNTATLEGWPDAAWKWHRCVGGDMLASLLGGIRLGSVPDAPQSGMNQFKLGRV